MASKTETRGRKASSPKVRPQTRAPAEVRSDDPPYLQVVRALKEEIVGGVHPTIVRMAERVSVNPHRKIKQF